MEYLKKHPRTRNVPFATKFTEKLFNKNGTPKLNKNKKQKTKSRKRRYSEYTINNALYGCMSLNEVISIMSNIRMRANEKKKWKGLGLWIAEKQNLSNKKIQNAIIEFKIFSHTKAKKDCDNSSGGIKFLNDGMIVESKMFPDDNFNFINPLIISLDVDSTNPRTEIRITTFNKDVKDIYEKMKIHIENWNK